MSSSSSSPPPTTTAAPVATPGVAPAASGQRILTICDDPILLAQLNDAVAAGGGVPMPVAGAQLLADGPPQLPFRFVVLGWDGGAAGLRLVTERLRDGAQVVGVTPPSTLAAYTKLLEDPRCNHVITADEAGFRMVTVAVQKFVSGDLFGIEKYVPAGTEVHLSRLREYKGRTQAIDEVLLYAEQVGVRRQVRSAIGQVCEELLMNALYDAPIDQDGNPLFAEVELKARLEKLSPRPVSIRYAATETGFAVAVRDRFGRLDKATVLRYIDKCLHSTQQIDRKTYGAGLGIYLIANAASHFVLNVAPGMATEVVCTFDRKSARAHLRGLSVFVYPGTPQSSRRMTPTPPAGG